MVCFFYCSSETEYTTPPLLKSDELRCTSSNQTAIQVVFFSRSLKLICSLSSTSLFLLCYSTSDQELHFRVQATTFALTTLNNSTPVGNLRCHRQTNSLDGHSPDSTSNEKDQRLFVHHNSVGHEGLPLGKVALDPCQCDGRIRSKSIFVRNVWDGLIKTFVYFGYDNDYHKCRSKERLLLDCSKSSFFFNKNVGRSGVDHFFVTSSQLHRRLGLRRRKY